MFEEMASIRRVVFKQISILKVNYDWVVIAQISPNSSRQDFRVSQVCYPALGNEYPVTVIGCFRFAHPAQCLRQWLIRVCDVQADLTPNSSSILSNNSNSPRRLSRSSPGRRTPTVRLKSPPSIRVAPSTIGLSVSSKRFADLT